MPGFLTLLCFFVQAATQPSRSGHTKKQKAINGLESGKALPATFQVDANANGLTDSATSPRAELAAVTRYAHPALVFCKQLLKGAKILYPMYPQTCTSLSVEDLSNLNGFFGMNAHSVHGFCYMWICLSAQDEPLTLVWALMI